MKNRRHRNISVLLVPDGNAEPYSFRLSMGMVKFLLIFALIIAIHVLGGGFAYYKWFAVSSQNSELVENNIRLLKDNKRIFQLEQQVEAWRVKQRKLMDALGVTSTSVGNLEDIDFGAVKSFDAAPSRSRQVEIRRENRKSVEEDSNWDLRRKKTPLHSYTPNLPTALPVNGFLTEDFSPQDWLYGKRHFGIDIAGKTGEEIRAAGNGVVIFAGWTQLLGNLIIINHGDDIFSFYGHNSRLLVSERSVVKKNQPIAELGNTGKSTGPHLHFEIWEGGKPIDPREYVLALQDE